MDNRELEKALEKRVEDDRIESMLYRTQPEQFSDASPRRETVFAEPEYLRQMDHGQKERQHPVSSRVLSVLFYLLAIVILTIGVSAGITCLYIQYFTNLQLLLAPRVIYGCMAGCMVLALLSWWLGKTLRLLQGIYNKL